MKTITFTIQLTTAISLDKIVAHRHDEQPRLDGHNGHVSVCNLPIL